MGTYDNRTIGSIGEFIGFWHARPSDIPSADWLRLSRGVADRSGGTRKTSWGDTNVHVHGECIIKEIRWLWREFNVVLACGASRWANQRHRHPPPPPAPLRDAYSIVRSVGDAFGLRETVLFTAEMAKKDESGRVVRC